MHRTVGNAYIEVEIESEIIRLSQDETGEEGVLGTEFYAGMVNSIQEEICRVIEYAGITLYDDHIDDQSAAWGQLRDAIFSSEAIDTDALTDAAVTDAKVTSVSLDKIISGYCEIEKTHLGDIIQVQINSEGGGGSPWILVGKLEDGTYPEYWSEITYNEIRQMVKTADGVYMLCTITGEQIIGNDETHAISDGYSLRYGIGYDEVYLRYEHEAYPDPGYQIIVTSMSRVAGFTKTVYEEGSTEGYCKLDTDGLFFLNSSLSIKHTVVSFGITGWSGSGPYTKSVATHIPFSAHIMGTMWASKSFSAPIYTVTTFFTGTDINSITLTGGSTYTAHVSLNYNPGGTSIEHYLLIFYADA